MTTVYSELFNLNLTVRKLKIHDKILFNGAEYLKVHLHFAATILDVNFGGLLMDVTYSIHAHCLANFLYQCITRYCFD